MAHPDVAYTCYPLVWLPQGFHIGGQSFNAHTGQRPVHLPRAAFTRCRFWALHHHDDGNRLPSWIRGRRIRWPKGQGRELPVRQTRSPTTELDQASVPVGASSASLAAQQRRGLIPVQQGDVGVLLMVAAISLLRRHASPRCPAGLQLLPPWVDPVVHQGRHSEWTTPALKIPQSQVLRLTGVVSGTRLQYLPTHIPVPRS